MIPTVKVEIGPRGDIARVIRSMQWRERWPQHQEAANMRVSAELYRKTMLNFEAEGGFFTAGGWKPLSPKYLKRKLAQGYSPKILHRTGNLRASFEAFADRRIAGVGARASYGVDYAAVHELGLGNMPRRRMLPTWADVKADIVPIYERAVEQYFKGER